MATKITEKRAEKLIDEYLNKYSEITLKEANTKDIYKALTLIAHDILLEKREDFHALVMGKKAKRVHYLCMEFLLGRNLKNALFNLQLDEVFTSVLKKHNVNIDDVYETYREIGGDKQKNTLKTWLNGRTMGPESIEDISIVGSISGITEIIDNAKYIDEQFNIIRNQKRLIGRYLFKVISDILHHNPNSEDDPRTEILRNTLSERIFRIEAVTTIQ